MSIFVNAKEFVTLPTGLYPGTMYAIEETERTPYNKPDSKDKIPALVWKIRLDVEDIPEDIMDRIRDPEDELITIESTDQPYYTGRSFGSPRATLTSLLRILTGNPQLAPKEAKRIDLEKLLPLRVVIMLDEVENDQKEMRNKITGISLEKKGKGK